MTPISGSFPGVLDFSADADPSRYRELLRDARSSRRCPVWFGATGTSRLGTVAVPADPVGEIDAAVLRASASASGLARYGSADRSREERTVRVAGDVADRLAPISTMGLVDVARPADVPAALAWGGARRVHPDLVGLGAVLRSWEERFGAVLVLLHEATMILSVADPPSTRGTAARVAEEHFAFCPAQHGPQNGAVHTPHSYAPAIRDERLWRFWWD